MAELDREIIDDIVLVDDASHDQTVPVARQIGLAPRSCRSTTPGCVLSFSSLALLLLAVIAAACAQLMLKYGMQAATTRAHHGGGSLMLAAAASPWVLGGLAVFAMSAVAWLGVLSRVPLSVAYPFNALGYIAILTASIVVLHERASLLTWAGSPLVVSGLVIVVLSKP